MHNRDGYLWWKHGCIYQIYPRSFSDSDEDGIGDLRGIINRIEYLEYLGVDGIWLSPIFPSPMKDFGYDVSDYKNIHPIFGSLTDFDELVSESHRRNIRIILDLVMNHTSNAHPWFTDSASSKKSEKRNWYMWHPGIRHLGIRRPPNNWRAAFGGSAWTWDPNSREYYLHLFLAEQPDLNWRNTDVESAMFSQAKFWLERGVDGFRLDVINYIVKDDKLRSNPYRLRKAPPRLHDQQLHLYDRNRPETHEILKRLRMLHDKYPETMLVGEIYPNEGLPDPASSASYQGSGTDELHLAFDFSPMYVKFSVESFRRILSRWYAVCGENRWPCHVLSNHDQSRAMTRLCGGNESKARLLAALLLTQRGTAFLYYGEEIGMVDGKIRRKDMMDPLGLRYWPLHPGRDRSRTPMQWSASGGFTAGDKSWLPQNPDTTERDVDAQKADGASLLSWYRKLISLRRSLPQLNRGDIRDLRVFRGVLSYKRIWKDRSLLVLLNFTSQNRRLLLSNTEAVNTEVANTEAEILADSLCADPLRSTVTGAVKLEPLQALVLDTSGMSAHCTETGR